MHCIGCAIAAGETIAQAAEVHGIDINKLVEELNKNESKGGGEGTGEGKGKGRGKGSDNNI
jgi:hypothetical protein